MYPDFSEQKQEDQQRLEEFQREQRIVGAATIVIACSCLLLITLVSYLLIGGRQ